MNLEKMFFAGWAIVVMSVGCAKQSDLESLKAEVAEKADRKELQLFAQDSLDRDAGLDQKYHPLLAAVADIKGRLESMNGTLGTLQPLVEQHEDQLIALEGAFDGLNIEGLREETATLRDELDQVQQRFGTVDLQQLEEQIAQLAERTESLGCSVENAQQRLATVEEVANAAAPRSALASLKEEVSRLGQYQGTTAAELAQAKQAVATTLGSLREEVVSLNSHQQATTAHLVKTKSEVEATQRRLAREKLNRFVRYHPWVGDDFYQVIDRHQNGSRSGPTRTFVQRRDGSLFAEVYVWSSIDGYPHSTREKALRKVTCEGGMLVYDGYDAGGWPCKHRIPTELFPALKLSLFDRPARR